MVLSPHAGAQPDPPALAESRWSDLVTQMTKHSKK
jgi:hypothetical protein